ncbi:hypothetical protein [Paraclostridium bifermentans]|uniref:hypothetical protein n=1 Tax=Paraclostridium bifermentans TaxID=1490 RepID=UPI0018FE68C5|nr:hypothetical protein [Paraclostridium bifermentans]
MFSDGKSKYKSKYRKFIILFIIFQLLIGEIIQYFHPEDIIRFYYDIENVIATFLLIILYFLEVRQQRKFNIPNKDIIQKDNTIKQFSFNILIDIFILASLIYNIYLSFSILFNI